MRTRAEGFILGNRRSGAGSRQRGCPQTIPFYRVVEGRVASHRSGDLCHEDDASVDRADLQLPAARAQDYVRAPVRGLAPPSDWEIAADTPVHRAGSEVRVDSGG